MPRQTHHRRVVAGAGLGVIANVRSKRQREINMYTHNLKISRQNGRQAKICAERSPANRHGNTRSLRSSHTKRMNRETP